ncbi:hypothetical protein BMS3Abin05_02050 [bacterium BMS3Abin05]|nr:hypothetical protein BMS3Abin05_02050 [bacterium BMS3Abin05]
MTIIKKFNKFRPYLFLSVSCAVVFSSCGHYSFSGNTLPAHIKTVAIPLFNDKTSEFGVREKLTNAVVDAFTQDNTLKIVDVSRASAVVSGTIESVTDRASTFNRQEKVEAYRVYVTVDVEFRDQKKRKILWKAGLQEWGEYQHSNSTEERQKAIDDAIKKLAEDILNKSVSGW